MATLKLENCLVIAVSEIEYKGSNNFETRHVVVQSDYTGQYPQYHKVDFNGDRTDRLDNIKQGDIVTVDVNVNGRKWTDREGKDQYFNSLDGWKIKKDKNATPATAYTQPVQGSTPVDLSAGADDDDLPF